jgi:hypothetical protein
MIMTEFYVLHFPYNDGSWRGLEKCVTTEDSDAPLFFVSPEDAYAYMRKHDLEDLGCKVVEFQVHHPNIRQPFQIVPRPV